MQATTCVCSCQCACNPDSEAAARGDTELGPSALAAASTGNPLADLAHVATAGGDLIRYMRNSNVLSLPTEEPGVDIRLADLIAAIKASSFDGKLLP
jgi:hypothetical protein